MQVHPEPGRRRRLDPLRDEPGEQAGQIVTGPAGRHPRVAGRTDMHASGMSLLKEEIFGPVAAILPFGTFDEALALANDSPYGLGATLFSRDARRVRRYFEEIEVGNVWVNDPLVDNPAGPFGGMKMSGLGRELGEEGLEEFQQTKHVHWDIEGPIKPWWFPLEK
jgi:acyl-CoA reductase-like NAD-dependent aldehyde dehydrogenase